MTTPYLFRWRTALLSEHGPPLIRRHILNVLSGYGDETGASIYPSTRELERATGATRRSVMTHLSVAEEEGWIVRHVLGTDSGKGWKRHSYQLRIPPDVVNGVHREGGERGAPRPHEGGEPHAHGGESHDTKVVNEVHLTSPLDLSSTSPSPPERAADASAPNSEAREKDAVEGDENSTSDSMAANELVGAWISRQPKRPPESVIRKQGAFAKRLVRDCTRSELERAVDGIGRLFPHSDGTPWDLGTLEKKLPLALAAPATNGNRRGYQDPAAGIDYAAEAAKHHGGTT